MKKILLPLLLACCATLNAEDCAKNTDACTAGKKTIVSPFLAASARPLKTAEPVKKDPAPRPAPLAAPATAPVQAPVPARYPETSSSPLWLLLVGAGIAGLYFYLGGKKAKKAKKR